MGSPQLVWPVGGVRAARGRLEGGSWTELGFHELVAVIPMGPGDSMGCGVRPAGFIAAAVGLLRRATDEGDEPAAIAASIAISATCTASDGNKRAAARLPGGEDPEDSRASALCVTSLSPSFPPSFSLSLSL